MRSTRILTAFLVLALLEAGVASAQTVLRIGLNDDPDALDPTISRAYVGRLVFAAFCDKLFDVTPDLKIVPQLATGYEWGAGGRSVVIRLRPGVKLHVGERFAEYWDKANIHVDRIEFVPITDSTARLANLRSGDLQMIERVSPTDLAQVRADGKLKVVGIAELGYQMLPLNLNNGPRGKVLGADPRIRQAIDLAIDRETIIKTVFNNEYLPGNQFVSPMSPYYNAKLPVKRRDVARARQLLRESGHPNLAFTLIVPPERDRQESALVIQAMLAEAGITLTIQTQENVTLLSAGRKGDFEAYFTFWSGRPDPDGNIFAFTTCSGGQNDSKYCNQDVDAILTKARHEADPAERKKLYDQTTEIMLRDLPRLILWHRRVFTGLSGRVQGFTPYPDGIIRVKGLKLS